jgi:O-antigen/teichoic acid export membrane protein
VRTAGAIAVLWIKPSIVAFFWWMCCAGAFQTLLTAVFLWRALPRAQRPAAVRIESVDSVWRFAVGMGATAVVALVIGQLDKLVVSAVLPLNIFGEYVIASTLAAPPSMAAAPVSDAVFPRYAQLATANREIDLADAFHKGCQAIAVLAFPVAATLMVYAPQILALWTRKPDLAASVGFTTTLLVFGAAVNVMLSTLDGLQIAYGWLKPAFLGRLISIIILPPLIVFLSRRDGTAGAAAAWLVMWSVSLLITPQFVYRRLLVSEKSRWYLRDMGYPFAMSVAVVLVIRASTDFPQRVLEQLALLVGTWASAAIFALTVSPAVRTMVMAYLRHFRPAYVRS